MDNVMLLSWIRWLCQILLLQTVLNLLDVIWVWITNWDRVTLIWLSKLAIIGSDNGLQPVRHQAIIWTNVGILLIGTLRKSFNDVLSEIHIFSHRTMHLKMSPAKWWPFFLGLNALNVFVSIIPQATLFTIICKHHWHLQWQFKHTQVIEFLWNGTIDVKFQNWSLNSVIYLRIYMPVDPKDKCSHAIITRLCAP